MKQQRTHDRTSTRKVQLGRMAGAIVALGGLGGLVVAEGTAGAATKVVVSTTKNSKLGTILVSGKTLYTLQPSKTPCSTACLKVWPALMLPKGVDKATAGKGVTASKLGTVKRSGGNHQVTYAGKPLYGFVGDRSAGQVHGNLTDTWGKWSVVVTVKPAHATSSTGSSTSTSSGSSSGGSGAGTGGAAF
jgi:predicted lipoprotein with Yx(FWY)xxD motif